VQLINDSGTTVYETGYKGPAVDGDSRPTDHPEVTEPYIAYSPNASATVYSRLLKKLYFTVICQQLRQYD